MTDEDKDKKTPINPKGIGASTEGNLEKILSLCYVIPMGNPIEPDCIWGGVPSLEGPPGIGKSGRVRGSAKKVGIESRPIELGGRQPEDASGAPFLTKEDKLIIACILGAVNELNELGQGVLFLDEVNWARPTTQGAFLSMVQDRRVGDTVFSNLIRIVMASNPQRSAGGGHLLIPPMANRCLHFDVGPPSEAEENAYLMGNAIKVAPIDNAQQRVMEQWPNVWPKMVGQMIGFKKRFSQYVIKEPKPGDPQHHKAWPSPRSRELALRAAATVRILETRTDETTQREIISPLEDIFVEAACGKAMSIDWALYRDQAKMPSPEDMLAGKWKPQKGEKMDLVMGAFAGCISHVVQRHDKKERLKLAGPAYQLLLDAMHMGAGDIAITGANTLVSAGLDYHSMTGSDAAVAQRIMMEFGKRGLDKFL